MLVLVVAEDLVLLCGRQIRLAWALEATARRVATPGACPTGLVAFCRDAPDFPLSTILATEG